ncbi:MAG TPA: diaminopimelate epimerase [Methanomassiliicoccales archaeon]
MKFWKYHGIGNDFVILDNFDGSANKDPAWVRSVCDRRFGIGADGILYVERSARADATMSILNSDGSVAEMCGNGIRCMAKHLYDFGMVKKKHMTIDTLAGIKTIECTVTGDHVTDVKVGMGAAELECSKVPMRCPGKFIDSVLEIGGRKIRGTAVSMGNPHFITFQEFTDEEQERLAPLIQSDDSFPKRTNVEFVKSSNGILTVKVLERGAGWTMACGTGACATAVAAALQGLVPYESEIEVRLPGGSLWIAVSKDLGSVTMRGPAARVFQGETE